MIVTSIFFLRNVVDKFNGNEKQVKKMSLKFTTLRIQRKIFLLSIIYRILKIIAISRVDFVSGSHEIVFTSVQILNDNYELP